MKKSVLFILTLIAVIISASIFPVKDSLAVRSYEFWGTAQSINCTLDVIRSETTGTTTTTGADGSSTTSTTTTIIYETVLGSETTCNGFWGSCPGTNCAPSPATLY